MMKKIFLPIKLAILSIGLGLITFSFMSSRDLLDDKATVATQPGIDFRNAAKKAIPAVVSIKVQTKKGSPFFTDGESSKDPFDLFGNDFWEFFGGRQNLRSQPFIGQASGVIVSPDGYILTNSHVVNNMDEIKVQLHDGREFSAKVLGEDTNSDLALIKISAKDLPYLPLANSDNLEVGQWVAAIGNPFGLQATFTVGVISAKGRNNLELARYEDFIQTDTSINKGNSGGPLIDLNGEVIGINTAIATNSSAGYLGIGFAIPSNMAKHVIDEILSNGKVSHGFLGVSLQSIDYNLAEAFGLNKIEGALVTSVSKGSPAAEAGLQPEDIILKYDDHSVENSAVLRNAVYMMRPGTRTVLSVLRQDKIIQVPLVVGEFSEEVVSSDVPQKNRLGIEVENLSSELAQALGYYNEKGVVITKINPNSAAAFAGLKKGALIMAVNRKKVENIDDFNKILKEAPQDRPLLFQIRQGDRHLFVSLQLN